MARREKDPYTNFRFKLVMGDIIVAGFYECTGLQIETKVFEYKEGGRNTHSLKFPESSVVPNIVLKRGITQSNELYDWLIKIVEGNFNTAPNARPADPNQDISNNISIQLMDDSGKEVIKRWILRRAFPIKWSGPDMKATSNEIAMEILEIAHEGFRLG